MGRKNKKKDYGFKPHEKDIRSQDNHHVRITRNMLQSLAWQELTPYAVIIFIFIKAKYTGNNDDNLSFTYAEGAKLMNKRTFTKGVNLLIKYGFITLVEQNRHKKKANIYGLSDQWQRYKN